MIQLLSQMLDFTLWSKSQFHRIKTRSVLKSLLYMCIFLFGILRIWVPIHEGQSQTTLGPNRVWSSSLLYFVKSTLDKSAIRKILFEYCTKCTWWRLQKFSKTSFCWISYFGNRFKAFLTASACSKVLKEVLLLAWNNVPKILQIEQKMFAKKICFESNKNFYKRNKKCWRKKIDPCVAKCDLEFPYGIYCGIVWPYNCLKWPFYGLS